MPSSTLAAIGLSRVSNASSATAKLVSLTGTTRDLPQTRRTSGRSAGLTWTWPAAAFCSMASAFNVGGYISSSSVASAGWSPSSATAPF